MKVDRPKKPFKSEDFVSHCNARAFCSPKLSTKILPKYRILLHLVFKALLWNLRKQGMAESAKAFVKGKALVEVAKPWWKWKSFCEKNISFLKMERPLWKRQSLCESGKAFVRKAKLLWKSKWHLKRETKQKKGLWKKGLVSLLLQGIFFTSKKDCFVWISSKGWGGWPKQINPPNITCNAHWHLGRGVASHDSSQALNTLSI